MYYHDKLTARGIVTSPRKVIPRAAGEGIFNVEDNLTSQGLMTCTSATLVFVLFEKLKWALLCDYFVV